MDWDSTQKYVQYLKNEIAQITAELKFQQARFESMQKLWIGVPGVFGIHQCSQLGSCSADQSKNIEEMHKHLYPAVINCDICKVVGTTERPHDLPDDHEILSRCPQCVSKHGPVDFEYRKIEIPKDEDSQQS